MKAKTEKKPVQYFDFQHVLFFPSGSMVVDKCTFTTDIRCKCKEGFTPTDRHEQNCICKKGFEVDKRGKQ